MALGFHQIREGMRIEAKPFSLSEGAIRHHLKVYGREFGVHSSDRTVPITLLLSTFAGGCFLQSEFLCREIRSLDVRMLQSIEVNEEIFPEVKVVRLLSENRVSECPAGYVFLETTFRNQGGETLATAKCTVIVDQIRRENFEEACVANK